MAIRTQMTSKQRKFACNIISGMENLEAYHDAYPSSLNWNNNSTSVTAAKLRKKPMIAAFIAEGQKEARERAVITRQRALEILSEQAEGTVGAVIASDGSIDIEAVKRAGASIKSIQRTITTTENGECVSEKVTLNGQKEAIDSLARLENWNREKPAQTSSITLNFNLSPSKSKK